MFLPAAAQADIFRWDNGQLIPGTEGITPGPGVNLSYFSLPFANFFGGLDLTEANFFDSSLDNTRLNGANLTRANLTYVSLTNADLSGTNLTDAALEGADLTNANFAGAVVAGSNFALIPIAWGGIEGSGITLPQLYSTASYQQKNLQDIGLKHHDLTGWDFSGQDLTGADFGYSQLTNANLAGAVVAGANFFFDGPIGITKDQLFSTASYQQKNLRGIRLGYDLTGWDFSGQDLTDAELAYVTNVNLAGAMVAGAEFGGGFTKEQIYSTASYQQKNLRGIRLRLNDLTGWDFSGQDLTGADFFLSTLTNANFAGAVVAGANFDCLAHSGVQRGSGITLPQLYSTASYQQKNLRGIGLRLNDLTDGDFSGHDLTGADFGYSTLTNANLVGAMVTRASFESTTSRGFTKEQLYSTASYQQRDLRGIGLSNNDLRGWDFSGQDLAGADFTRSNLTNANFAGASLTNAVLRVATLTNANFSFADLRGAWMPSGPIQLARNAIREFGAINGLDLEAGETLVVRDSNFGIFVNDRMNAVSGGTLELLLGDADWGSTMSVAAGVTPDLGGTLRFRFADQANLASMLGTTFDFFDWPAVLETDNRFDAIELPPGTQWDLNQLYVTGTAKLTAIPVTPGDYNRDGTVDAADYVVWRSGLGTTYTQADYDVWRANFGQTIGSGAAPPSAEPLPIGVPEPATLALLIMAIVVHYARRRSTES
jgi:uncharacterized protein YjbI with pentapeptide repeats